MPILALIGLLLGGCAGTVNPAEPYDPWEQTNRSIFAFNNQVDENIALPVARFYRDTVPAPAREGVHNFLTNLSLPTTLGNDLLQGEITRGTQTLGRIVVNSTIGLAGFVDVATKIGIPFHTEDFGQTLAVWGVASGPYFVAPFVGPDPPRDLLGDIVDIFMDPFTYARFPNDTAYLAGRDVLNVVDIRERNIDTLEELRTTSIDYYAALRSVYLQYRQHEIDDNTGTPENLPEF